MKRKVFDLMSWLDALAFESHNMKTAWYYMCDKIRLW